MKILQTHSCPLTAMANHHDLPSSARAALMDGRTIHYEIKAITAAHMLNDETPIPDHVQAAIHWPHQTPTCVHYNPPIKMDPIPGKPPDHANMQGVIILPAPDGTTAVIITLGSAQGSPVVMRDTIDTTTRPGILESDESQQITRYYTRLARHITRALQARPHSPTTPARRAVTYTAKLMQPQDPRPQMEELIRSAAQRPRPFDVVIVASRWVLGTEEEADDFISRINEHGVDVAFADEWIE